MTLLENFAKLSPQFDSCPKFSIIIPVYNTEKYIAKCLDSLINQDTPELNYEILITDDGSTDTTGQICDDYAAKYPFILVTHTGNHGPSHARNIALDKCRGEYVMFCDADDFVSPQLVSVVTKATDVFGRPDMIVYRMIYEVPKSGWPVYDVEAMNESCGKLCDTEEACYRICADPMTGGYSWNKAVKRELALSVRYDEDLSVNEDEHYFLSMLLKNSNARVCRLNYKLYCYVQYQPSDPTRNPLRNRTKEGYPRHLEAAEKMLDLPNLPPKVAEQISGRNYGWAVGYLFSNIMPITPESYTRLKEHIRKSAGNYYLKYKGASLWSKVKTFIKHILAFIHIHKPRRK